MGLNTLMSRPFRADRMQPCTPRALSWAGMSCPFGAGRTRTTSKPKALPWAGMSCPFGAGRTHTTCVSLRSIIFQELVANIIALREYTSAAPATMMIFTDRVEFKNLNAPQLPRPDRPRQIHAVFQEPDHLQTEIPSRRQGIGGAAAGESGRSKMSNRHSRRPALLRRLADL